LKTGWLAVNGGRQDMDCVFCRSAQSCPVLNMKEYKPDLSNHEKLSQGEIVERYNNYKGFFPDALFELSEDQVTRSFDPVLKLGQWSCLQLVGHLVDAEYSFSHRMRRVFGENSPGFETWDEDSFLNRNIYSDINLRHYIEFLFSSRNFMYCWLKLLSGDDFNIHPVSGSQTLRAILNYTTWHLEHHGSFLLEKLAFLEKN